MKNKSKAELLNAPHFSLNCFVLRVIDSYYALRKLYVFHKNES